MYFSLESGENCCRSVCPKKYKATGIRVSLNQMYQISFGIKEKDQYVAIVNIHQGSLETKLCMHSYHILLCYLHNFLKHFTWRKFLKVAPLQCLDLV